MVKHWLSAHAELLEPPKFRMKVVGSFKDALSRQLSESVRIDLRGGGVLNSKTEYSRCRIPRLVVDMDEWKRKKTEETMLLEQHPNPEESESMEESLAGLPNEHQKRKNDSLKTGRQSKKKKLEPLMQWGEDETESSVWETWLEVEESTSQKRDWLSRKEPERPTQRMRQLELEFKSILQPVSSQQEQNGQADKTSIQEEQIHLTGSTTTIHTGGLPTENNIVKVASQGVNESNGQLIVEQNEAKDDSDYVKEPAKQNRIRTEMAKVVETKIQEGYKRKTGKMSKKEARSMAAKNRSMKDWVSKVITPTKPRMTNTDQDEQEIATEMEWEDAPDLDKAWRLAVAKEKTDRSRTRHMIKVMVMEMVDEMVSMVESTSVVGGIMDSLIKESSFVGEVNVVWSKLLNDGMLKEAIMMRLEQEDRDNTMLLEFRKKEGRLGKKQKKARKAWRKAKNNIDISLLSDDLSKI